MLPITITYKSYTITTDKSLMKVGDIHKWISERSYWALDIPFELFKRSFDNSFCIGALANDKQIGFARFWTDYAIFGYMADVYVAEEHRGQGISKKMIEVLLDLDWVKELRSIRLGTTDAHELYRQFGFTELKNPERMMEITRFGIYQKPLHPSR